MNYVTLDPETQMIKRIDKFDEITQYFLDKVRYYLKILFLLLILGYFQKLFDSASPANRIR